MSGENQIPVTMRRLAIPCGQIRRVQRLTLGGVWICDARGMGSREETAPQRRHLARGLQSTRRDSLILVGAMSVVGGS